MLRSERFEGTVVWTIDRPEAKNALDLGTIAELTAALAEPADYVRAVVITGAGDAFVSGGDLREMRGRDTRADGEALTDAGYDLMSAIAKAPFPVIAAVNGLAIGGGAELAVACDLRIAAPTARIAFKQARMGLTTSWGTTGRLRELVGHGTATRLLLTATDIGAKKAKKLGLVDEIADDARASAIEWAAEIAKSPASAIAATKRLLRAPLNEVRTLERFLFIDGWSSDEHKAAVEAWFARAR